MALAFIGLGAIMGFWDAACFVAMSVWSEYVGRVLEFQICLAPVRLGEPHTDFCRSPDPKAKP